MGVIPRAATALFEKLDGGAAPVPDKKANRSSMSQLRTPARYSMNSPAPAPKTDKNWQMKATYVEIYNETLRDLLLPDSVQSHERSAVSIREDQKGNIILTGLRQVDINSVEDLMGVLNFGSSIRQTDATAINAKSSRSHAVFSLNLVQKKPKSQSGADKRLSVPLEAMTGNETWVTTDSKLHFVDLAGSERLKNTGAQGERAKEGISINAGLAALGKVISQLSSRQAGSHVSYRDSRLTRLLQDSLGGNAITYMIACVTPAEFHLSETLNTVQYAQRARAIQSKPRIQQMEEGDKQAIIDRLKAEVSFLREQVRNAERSGSERRPVTNERSERQSEKENELQNQLLDIQENYTNLSGRHAKLISEMAKAREDEAAVNEAGDTTGDIATERLNRSNSFAQAVEQVVLEYEKTIQSLEQSLSSTRATLSNSETSLLEKETKCAYVETINTQLQARLQKLMDREANTENYLHDLENKLDGHTSGEEKNATIILELRKEIARVRENEAGCEDYISTLEERLAEADQDTELMQREIDRLEQVIERQRSLGKLDNLLTELDNMQDGKAEGELEAPNGTGHRRNLSERSVRSHVSRPSHGLRGALPEVKEGTEEEAPEQSAEGETADAILHTQKSTDHLGDQKEDVSGDEPTSPAQSKFVADKLENVSQELIDLRVEHETTVNEYDALHSKYEEALRALADLQDQVDEARHPGRKRDSMLSVTSPDQTRPPSFLSDARSSDTRGGTQLSSRSLSSELSSAMDSPTTIDTPRTETPKPSETKDSALEEKSDHIALLAEYEKLKNLANEKETAEQQLAEKYSQLESQHQETLVIVEELKTEVSRARWHDASSPTSPRSAGPVIRRKSSQNLLSSDRAQRSFVSLRNIAAEHFENNPDMMQSFEININSAMNELSSRSDRIAELEADVANTKKEMETKMTIISGLTRERNSIKTSPMDISAVATMREQLERSEGQLRRMQESHAKREAELLSQLQALQTSINDAAEARAMSVPSGVDSDDQDDIQVAHQKKIIELQSELAGWEGKHQFTLEAMQATERQMKKTIDELEKEVASVNARLESNLTEGQADDGSREVDQKHQDQIKMLRSEIDEYKAIINSNAAKVAELEQQHAAMKDELEVASTARATDSTGHQDLINKLQAQISDHEEAVKTHQSSLEQLHTKHAEELDSLKAGSKEAYDAEINLLMTEHAENIKILESDATEAREELMKIATQVAFALGLDVSVEKLSERIDDLVSDQKALGEEQKQKGELEGYITELTSTKNAVVRDLESVKSTLSDMLSQDGTAEVPIQDQLAALQKKMTDLENKNKKHSRLVEELEDQLQTNYDQAQVTNNRLSTLQGERMMQLEEAAAAKIKAEIELASVREELAALQAKTEESSPNRTSSINSQTQVRKTSSITSMPSPPPAVPLPPLPPAGASSPTAASPTPTSGRPQSNDQALAQLREDHEARIQSVEKALDAERQLTSTLEEALSDLETQSKKVKADSDGWRKRAQELETEIKDLKDKPQPQDNRWRDSLHQVEEERKKRQEAERARIHLEERMNAINNKKKKKGSLNCF